MITPLTITSLNQGKELARRQVEKLYAEPAEPALTVVVEEIAATEPAVPKPYALRSARPSLVAQFFAFGNFVLPIGQRRI